MQIKKQLVQFLQSDADGKFGKVASVTEVVTLDLDDGVSARVTGKSKVGVGDKIYFDDEGKMTKIVAAPKRERPKAESKTPVQGCAYVKHEL